MDVESVSLIVGISSVALAVFAIWYGNQSRRESVENYNRTKDVLAEISTKAAVIEATMNNTQTKLVDTLTDIVRPQRETQEEMMMRVLAPMLGNPDALTNLERLAQLGTQQGEQNK